MIVNMTPHPVMIIDQAGNVIKRFETAGQIRLASQTVTGKPIEGIPTSKTVFGDAVGLPEEQGLCPRCMGTAPMRLEACPDCGSEFVGHGKYYIVSQMVKSALPGRRDLLVPAEVVRDSSGNIIGCRSLGR